MLSVSLSIDPAGAGGLYGPEWGTAYRAPETAMETAAAIPGKSDVAAPGTNFNELALTSMLDQGSNYVEWTTNIEAKATYVVWNDEGYYREVERDYATSNKSGSYGDRETGKEYYYKIILEDRQGNVLETDTYTQVWGYRRILEYEFNPQVVAEGEAFSMKIEEGDDVILTIDGMTDFMSYDNEHFLNIAPREGDAGEYHLTVTAVDSEGYRNTKVVRVAVTDNTTAPVVTDFEVVGKYGDSANVRWATKTPCSVYLEYGTHTDYSNRVDMTDEPGTMHYAKLEGLTENSVYHYRIVCEDESGNIYVSPDQTLETTERTVINLFDDTDGDTVNLDFPYSLDQEGAVYVLQRDIVAKRSAFQILHDNITLDLNGHTVVYGDGPSYDIANWSFEEGESGWDFSEAPDAEVMEGVYSADKGGGQVYTGSHSLAFTLYEGVNEQYVISEEAIEIQAGYSYNLSAMMYGHLDSYTEEGSRYSPDVQMYVQLVDAETLEPLTDNIEAVDDGICIDLGFYYKQATFRTEDNMRVKIKIGVRGNGVNDPNVFARHAERTVRVDDIVLVSAYSYGVIKPSHYGRADEPDTMTCSLGHGVGAVVKNGTFIQSEKAKAFASDSFRNLNDAEIANVTSIVYGTDSHNVFFSNTGGVHIHDCEFIDRSTNVSSRHQQTGGNVKISSGLNLIENNRITGGSQYGININSGGLTEATGEIARNFLSNDAKCTQGYNIASSGDDLYIHHNDIVTENGNGIQLTGENVRAYANYLNLSRKPTQEFGWRDRHVGIELRHASYTELWENEVIVRNKGDRDYSCALSLRDCQRGLHIHDNSFTGIGTSPQDGVQPYTAIRASAARYYADESSDAVFDHNVFRSNDSIITFESSLHGGVFSSDNTFERLNEGTVIQSMTNGGENVDDIVTPTDKPFQVLKYFWCPPQQLQRDAGSFYDTALVNIEDVLDNTYKGSRAWEGNIFRVSLSVADAFITVFDLEGNIVFKDTTDPEGNVDIPLLFKERAVTWDMNTLESALGPYVMLVSREGYRPATISIDSDTPQDLTCEMQVNDQPFDNPTVSDLSIALDEDSSAFVDLQEAGVDASEYVLLTHGFWGTINSFDLTTGTFTYTPNEHFNGNDSIYYCVKDADGNYSEAKMINVTVNSVNDDFEMTAEIMKGHDGYIENGTVIVEVDEGATSKTLGIQIPAHNVDEESLSYTVADLPAGAHFDESTGELTWTVDAANDGIYTVTITVTDGEYTHTKDFRFEIGYPYKEIALDQAWFETQGESPYLLSRPNTKYVLSQDVTTTATAFNIEGHDVELDLNGHTITYDNEANPTGGYGIIVGRSFNVWNDMPGGWNWVKGNVKIHNGIIRQGQGNHPASHGVAIAAWQKDKDGNGLVEIANLEISVSGNGCINVYGGHLIHDNLLVNTANDTVRGAGISCYGGRDRRVYDNLIRTQGAYGIVGSTAEGEEGEVNRIFENDIYVESSSGTYALSVGYSDHGSILERNNIHVIGYGNGIFAGEDGRVENTKILDNRIEIVCDQPADYVYGVSCGGYEGVEIRENQIWIRTPQTRLVWGVNSKVGYTFDTSSEPVVCSLNPAVVVDNKLFVGNSDLEFGESKALCLVYYYRDDDENPDPLYETKLNSLESAVAAEMERLLLLNDLGNFEIQFIASSATEPFIAGDLNGDGKVGSLDVYLIRLNWDSYVSPGSLAMGDADGDGLVSSSDLSIVRAHWSETIPVVAAVGEEGNLSSGSKSTDSNPSEIPTAYGPAEADSRDAAVDAVFSDVRELAEAAWLDAIERLRTRERFRV